MPGTVGGRLDFAWYLVGRKGRRGWGWGVNNATQGTGLVERVEASFGLNVPFLVMLTAPRPLLASHYTFFWCRGAVSQAVRPFFLRPSRDSFGLNACVFWCRGAVSQQGVIPFFLSESRTLLTLTHVFFVGGGAVSQGVRPVFLTASRPLSALLYYF